MDISKISKNLLKPRKKDAHKKSVGRVLIVAGSKGMIGAAVLCAKAAMRAGAGYTALAFPENLEHVYKELIPEVVTYPLPEKKGKIMTTESLKIILEKEKEFDVLVIGPGVSRDKKAVVLVREIIKKSEKPLVLDADALFAISSEMKILKNRKGLTILTPHEAEMSYLTGQKTEEIHRKRKETAKKFAMEHDVFLVLKGHQTIIATRNGEIYVDNMGGPELATAGTGDVLSGIIAVIFSENTAKTFEAIILAVFLHGLAGKLAKEKFGERSVIASDLIEFLPAAILKTLEAR